MNIIRENRLLVSVLGGLAVIMILVLVFNGDDSPPEADPGSSIGTTTPTATVAADGDRFPRPNIEQLDCGPLLTFDDVDPVLGTTEWLTFSGGETCTHQLLDDNGVFVRIAPGHPTDLIDSTLEGVTGRRIPDVGDAAVWFGGEVSTLSVAAEGRYGVLVFRVTVSRSELDEDERLEGAKALALAALPRFPGISVAPPAPETVLVTIEHEPPDPADQDLVANLLVREAAGEWTRGEGLVASLGLLAGEADAAEVLRHSEVRDLSGTGIMRLAQTFLEEQPQAAEAPEIERLVETLTPTPELAAQTSARPGSRASSAISVQEGEEYPDECFSVWPDHGDPCFFWTEADPAYGQKYLFWAPDLDEWEGWVRGPSTIFDAVVKSVKQFEGMDGELPRVEVYLGPFEGHSVVLLEEASGTCWITLNKGAQALRDQGPPLLQQAVASTIARCYVDWNFGAPEEWESPAAWYLSDVIYPNASIETKVLTVPALLAGEELRTTLTERSLTNMPFFEHIHRDRGLEGAMAALLAIVEAGPGAIEGIDDLWHEYAKRLTDGVISDRGGAHTFGAGAERYDASPGLTVRAQARSFGLERVQFTAPPGMYACMLYPDAGNLDLAVSWRAGTPGGGGSWSTSLPTDVQGTVVFVITAGEADGSFDLKVDDVGDEPGCEDEEDSDDEETDELGEPCGFCAAGSFYYDSVEDWLKALAEGE